VFGGLRGFVVAAALLLPTTGVAQVQVNQVFNLQGPSPSIGPISVVQSGDIPGPPLQGSVTGAVQVVVTDPNDANRIYIGTPNGGVWATSDSGNTWKALTDKQATLSISSLDIDPTDTKRLIAGSGLTSSSCLLNYCFIQAGYVTSGGNQNGLLYSKDEGKTWASLGGGSGPHLSQSGPLSNQTVVGVAARGTTMLAATFQMSGFAQSRTEGGLYLSQDGGPFKLISGASGANQLPSGPVTSLVGVPGSPGTLYAAVTASSASTYAQTGVYVTTDTGATWTKVFSQSNSGLIQSSSQTVIKLATSPSGLATSPSGAVAIGLMNLESKTVTGLFWSNNAASGSWTSLGAPPAKTLNDINQVPINFAIAIDPKKPNMVYFSGDETEKAPDFTVSAYRVDATASSKEFTSIVGPGFAANGTTTHSDSRSLAFDAKGNLILASDGGVYLRTSPESSNNGVNALLTGGLNIPRKCSSDADGCIISTEQSPITVADSDGNGKLSGWRAFGQGLPNTQISMIAYSPDVDVLAVATYGRGAAVLYDVTSYFKQATTLQFGLANNDSQPDASFLTDGADLNRTGFSRPLNKYGTGTLTIAGDATYTGGTNIFAGALYLGNGGASGSIRRDVAFCSDAGNPLCDPSINKMLVFNRSDTYTFDGAISGPGQVVQFGTGRTVLTAASTYSGPTTILGGTLSVNGSIASSPVFVNVGGTLGGNGTAGPTTILAGGTLSPGNSVGTLTVNGNLAFAAASLYMVEVEGNTADRTNASGTATLAGTVGVSHLGGKLARNYTILSAAAGRTGTFDSLVPMNLPAFITASLAYTPTDVELNLESGIRRIAGLTRNHAGVAAALDRAFDRGGSLFHLHGLAPSQIPAALDMLSGEGVSGTQETAFGAASMFNSIMMDQGAFWRNRETVDINGVTFAGEPLPYAPAKKSKNDHPAFKALLTKEPPIDQPRWRAWLTSFDGSAKLAGEADIGSADLTHNIGGLAGGLDYQFAPDLLAGIAFGGSSSNFSVRDRITSGHLDAAHFGGYGVKTWGPVYTAGRSAFPRSATAQRAASSASARPRRRRATSAAIS
jgi:autotransporter-associated beta strand protein